MIVPPVSDPRWHDLVTGQLQIDLDSLATKILLARISALAALDPTAIEPGVEELRSLFKKNSQTPKIQRDLLKVFGSNYHMGSAIYEFDEIVQGLSEGRTFLLAGPEAILSRLPAGNWIGGTAPLIEGETMDLTFSNQVFATEMPDFILGAEIKVYEDSSSLAHLFKEAPPNSFSIIIIPYLSPMHLSFALNAPTYPGFATTPLAGWISGVPVGDIGSTLPKVFNGRKAQSLTNAAVVMTVTLPPDKFVEVDAVNIFEQGSGDIIMVETDGFDHAEVLINGQRKLFAEYIRANWHDSWLPLVADYHGLMVNSSFHKIDEPTGQVKFFAPLFKGVEYRLAKAITNYEVEFLKKMPVVKKCAYVFSFNCFVNYMLFNELKVKTPANLFRPTTFGEIAYQLFNQTMVYITISEEGSRGIDY